MMIRDMDAVCPLAELLSLGDLQVSSAALPAAAIRPPLTVAKALLYMYE